MTSPKEWARQRNLLVDKVINSRQLTRGAKVTWVNLAFCWAWNSPKCYPSHRVIAEALNAHRRSVADWIDELATAGLIEDRERKKRGYCYQLATQVPAGFEVTTNKDLRDRTKGGKHKKSEKGSGTSITANEKVSSDDGSAIISEHESGEVMMGHFRGDDGSAIITPDGDDGSSIITIPSDDGSSIMDGSKVLDEEKHANDEEKHANEKQRALATSSPASEGSSLEDLSEVEENEGILNRPSNGDEMTYGNDKGESHSEALSLEESKWNIDSSFDWDNSSPRNESEKTYDKSSSEGLDWEDLMAESNPPKKKPRNNRRRRGPSSDLVASSGDGLRGVSRGSGSTDSLEAGPPPPGDSEDILWLLRSEVEEKYGEKGTQGLPRTLSGKERGQFRSILKRFDPEVVISMVRLFVWDWEIARGKCFPPREHLPYPSVDVFAAYIKDLAPLINKGFPYSGQNRGVSKTYASRYLDDPTAEDPF